MRTAKASIADPSEAARRLAGWNAFFARADAAGIPDDFLADRQDAPAQERTGCRWPASGELDP